MESQHSSYSITDSQQAQIEDWLRLADKYIRSARYLAADEELQKIFALDPENEIAESFQDRIQFYVKQLSQRVGMNVDLQADIRRYNDRLAERNRNRIQLLLVKGERSLEEGYVKKAAEYVRKALVYDPENVYAHVLQGKIHTQARKINLARPVNSQSIEKLRALLFETWRNGAPSQPQRSIVTKFQDQLRITEGTRRKLERETRNSVYKETLKEICTNQGISALSSLSVDTLMQKFSVSTLEHSFIEGELLREIRHNKLKGSILVVDEDNQALNEIAVKLRANAYTVTRAANIHEAVQALKSTRPDAIISEVNFNGAPLGFDLFEFTRNIRYYRQTPFFFITNSFTKAINIIGKRLGVDDFFYKPIDYEILSATITGRLIPITKARQAMTMQS